MCTNIRVNRNKTLVESDSRGRRHTFPVLIFFTSNATSFIPSGALFTSQMLVSSPSPGTTGAVKRTPKYRSAEGAPSPTALRIARAANPNVDRPWRITPPKPASDPKRGSVHFTQKFLFAPKEKGRTDVKRVVVT
jgi:hypothetical protein